ncbi:DUF5681 domain-containing protein [Candidatus Marimicrobium litorale]|uniref:DUF5681 domain-containing protein n=1 Tax=Candidatus Marimicrobium litorale TaxID=2518991 RepID=UPI002430E8CE|nr:DUF5681 domain-containing protein [Candidatus Marimicrobium litorale]
MSDDTDDYEVGYGKPPKHSQFKPGKSGNPKGRPNRTRNFKTDLQEELQAKVTVTEGGQTQTISRQQAMIKRTIEKALKGDLRAVQLLAQWVATYLVDDPEALTAEPLTGEDLTLLARYGLDREPEPDKPETIEGGQEDD